MARLAPRGLCLSKSQRQIPFGTRRSSLALVARRALHSPAGRRYQFKHSSVCLLILAAGRGRGRRLGGLHVAQRGRTTSGNQRSLTRKRIGMLKPRCTGPIVSSKVSRFSVTSRGSRVCDPSGGSGPFRPLRISPSHASRAQRASGSIGATLRPCCEQTCEQVHKFTRLFTARSRSRPDTQTDVTSVRKGRSLMRNEPGIAASRPPQPGWRPGPRQASDAAHRTRDTLSPTPTPTLLPLLPQPLRAQPAPSLASVLPLLQVLRLFLPPLPLLPLPSPLPPPHTSLGLALVAGEHLRARNNGRAQRVGRGGRRDAGRTSRTAASAPRSSARPSRPELLGMRHLRHVRASQPY